MLWEQYPYPDDVVASLTDPFAGMAGVTADGDDPFYSVALEAHVWRWLRGQRARRGADGRVRPDRAMDSTTARGRVGPIGWSGSGRGRWGKWPGAEKLECQGADS